MAKDLSHMINACLLSGRLLLVVAALLVMGGSLVIKKIVNIKV